MVKYLVGTQGFGIYSPPPHKAVCDRFTEQNFAVVALKEYIKLSPLTMFYCLCTVSFHFELIYLFFGHNISLFVFYYILKIASVSMLGATVNDNDEIISKAHGSLLQR